MQGQKVDLNAILIFLFSMLLYHMASRMRKEEAMHVIVSQQDFERLFWFFVFVQIVPGLSKGSFAPAVI